MTRLVALSALCAIAFSSRVCSGTPEDPYDGSWHFTATPYLWAPRITGTLEFTTSSGSKPSVSVTPIDYLDNLSVPVMITGDVRKGRWSVATDFVWVDFSGEKAVVESVSGPGGRVEVPIDAGTTVGLRATIWTLDGGYTVWRNEALTLDVVGGFRFFRAKASLDWRVTAGAGLLPESGSLSATEDMWNGVAGIRGKLRFGGGRWVVPYYLDVGAGTSDVTWLGLAGIGHAFGWGDVLLAYRDQGFDAGDGSLVGRLHLSGPAVGVGFHF